MTNQSKHLITAILILFFIAIDISGKCSSIKNLDSSNGDTTSIKVKKAFKLIKMNANNSQFVILDVRKPDDFLKEHITNAINIDFKSEDFSNKIDQLDKGKTYLVYCYGGFRSKSTMQLMENKGFTKIYNMKGGIMKWRVRKLPLSK
ncbi:MAG: rhodanese-like domain-containing protein [Bacteroidales bacterium]|nr:rhodanese-like domain-containing protein [Bacteroidales bacterium]